MKRLFLVLLAALLCVASAATVPAAPLLRDTFTGPDGSLLPAHLAEGGAGWTLSSGPAAVILGNRAVLKGGILRSSITAPADVAVSATVYKQSDPANFTGVTARVSADGQSFYCALVRASNQIALYKMVNGAVTFLSQGNAPFAAGESHTLTLTCVGPALTVFWDGVQVGGHLTDTSLATGGGVGFWGGDSTDDATHGVHVDALTARKPRIVGLLGDSNSADSRPGDAFKALLESQDDNLFVVLSNEAKGGATTADWLNGASSNYLSAAEAEWNGMRPSAVLITLGTNNAKVGVATTATAFQNDLSAIIAHLLSNCPSVQFVVLNQALYPTPGSFNGVWDASAPGRVQAYNATLPLLANGATIRLGAADVFAYSQAHPDIYADGIHLNDAGYLWYGQAWGRASLLSFLTYFKVDRSGFIPTDKEWQAVEILPATAAFSRLRLQNTSGTTLYVNTGAEATSAGGSYKLLPNGVLTEADLPSGAAVSLSGPERAAYTLKVFP